MAVIEITHSVSRPIAQVFTCGRALLSSMLQHLVLEYSIGRRRLHDKTALVNSKTELTPVSLQHILSDNRALTILACGTCLGLCSTSLPAITANSRADLLHKNAEPKSVIQPDTLETMPLLQTARILKQPHHFGCQKGLRQHFTKYT